MYRLLTIHEVRRFEASRRLWHRCTVLVFGGAAACAVVGGGVLPALLHAAGMNVPGVVPFVLVFLLIAPLVLLANLLSLRGSRCPACHAHLMASNQQHPLNYCAHCGHPLNEVAFNETVKLQGAQGGEVPRPQATAEEGLAALADALVNKWQQAHTPACTNRRFPGVPYGAHRHGKPAGCGKGDASTPNADAQ